MKKIVFIVLMFYVFGMMNAIAQKNYVTINVDRTKIKIPTQYQNIVNVNANLQDAFNNKNIFNRNWLCVFLDTTAYKKIGNKTFVSFKPELYVFFDTYKYYNFLDSTTYEYNAPLQYYIGKIINNKTDTLRNSKINSHYISVDYTKLYQAGLTFKDNTYNSINGIGFIETYTESPVAESKAILVSTNVIRVKNVLFRYLIYDTNFKDDSFERLALLSESFSKAILDANK